MCIVVLNKVMIGRYYPIESLVHRLHPLTKVLCTFLFTIIIFFSVDIIFNIIVFILLLLVLLFSNIPMNLYLRMILSMKWFLLSIFLFNLLLDVSFWFSLITILRIIYLSLYSSVLTLTTPPTEINFGLCYLLSPLKILKVPVNQVSLSITLAIRFIPSILDSASRILKAQANRGVDYYNSSFKGKIVALKSLIVPMFVLTLKKADDLADSMETRLYDINANRVNFRENKWGYIDSCLVMFHVLLLIFVVRSLFI